MLNVVFVHLGDASARHLWSNLQYMSNYFPEVSLHVVYSSPVQLKKIKRTNAKPYLYQPTDEDDQLLRNLEHNDSFRRGFWRFSIERLLALESWHGDQKIDYPLIHVESDILILPSFPFEKLSRNKNLSWSKFNETHDVSAILYSPNLKETKWLTNEIRKKISRQYLLTDMTVLSRIAQENENKVLYLPSLSKPQSSEFNGVFDGASVGMWMTGRDPRNNFGIIQRFLSLPEANDNPANFTYKFDYMKGELFAVDSQFKHEIYNLHVHSKRIGLFRAFWKANLWLDVARSRRLFPSTTFSLKALLSVLKDYSFRNGMMGLLTKAFHVIKSSNRGD